VPTVVPFCISGDTFAVRLAIGLVGDDGVSGAPDVPTVTLTVTFLLYASTNP